MIYSQSRTKTESLKLLSRLFGRLVYFVFRRPDSAASLVAEVHEVRRAY